MGTGDTTYSISNLGVGNYDITVTDENNCSSTKNHCKWKRSVLSTNIGGDTKSYMFGIIVTEKLQLMFREESRILMDLEIQYIISNGMMYYLKQHKQRKHRFVCG